MGARIFYTLLRQIDILRNNLFRCTGHSLLFSYNYKEVFLLTKQQVIDFFAPYICLCLFE